MSVSASEPGRPAPGAQKPKIVTKWLLLALLLLSAFTIYVVRNEYLAGLILGAVVFVPFVFLSSLVVGRLIGLDRRPTDLSIQHSVTSHDERLS